MSVYFPQALRVQLGPPIEVDGHAVAAVAAPRPPPQDPNHTRKQQYLGTWSHTGLQGLKAPRDMQKQDFGQLLMRLLEEIFRSPSADGAQRARVNRVEKVSVFAELHANGEVHYHFVILAAEPFSYVWLKQRLAAQKICVDISTSHSYYWTGFVYLSVPGADPDGKVTGDLDAEPWLSPGHPTVQETIQAIPRGARACDKQRVRRYLAVESGSTHTDVALSDKDFASQVVSRQFRDPVSLQAWVTSSRGKLRVDKKALPQDELIVLVGLEAYMFKHQGDLKRRMQFAWDAVNAPRTLALQQKTVWEFVLEARETHPCGCGGR